jgi:hypothetical protein
MNGVSGRIQYISGFETIQDAESWMRTMRALGSSTFASGNVLLRNIKAANGARHR